MPRGTKRKRGASKSSGRSRRVPASVANEVIDVEVGNPPLQKNRPIYGSREFIFLESDDDDLPNIPQKPSVISTSIPINSQNSAPQTTLMDFGFCNDLAATVAQKTAQIIRDQEALSFPTEFDSDFEDDYDIYSTKDIISEKRALMKQKTKQLGPVPPLMVNTTREMDPQNDCSVVASPTTNDTSDIVTDIDVSDVPITRLGTTKAIRQQKQLMSRLNSLSTHLKFQDRSVDESLDNVEVFDASFSRSIPVRVCWGTEYLKFQLDEKDTLLDIYKQIAEMHSVSMSKIVLSFNNETLQPSTKLGDIAYTIADTIEGGLINLESDEEPITTNDPNNITLKFQSKNKRETVELCVNKYDTFKSIKKQYMEKLKLTDAVLKLRFDGETIGNEDTPFSLDLEGEECIDIFHAS